MAAPAAAWLAGLFLLPFYVLLAIAFGTVDPLFRTPVPEWNPRYWDTTQLLGTVRDIVGRGAFLGPAVARTLVYVACASALCLAIGYPVAWFVARYGGRRRTPLLVLLLAPFWISYMMRLLAWVNLLQTDGLVNRALTGLGLLDQPFEWLGGRPVTVVSGLVYGYVPYMILVLFAALDRIDPSLLEAARDLGASRARTFLRVALPLSRSAILTGLIVVALPMSGDYFTNDLLSGSPHTAMSGNLINDAVSTPGQGGRGAVLVLLLMTVLIPPMLWYVTSTARQDRPEAA